jgi:peptidoglycan/xylan/chitin deacetylase (PgdA/CDA1 family)
MLIEVSDRQRESVEGSIWDRTTPCVVISLDFELRWGMHDRLGFNMDRKRASLEGAWQATDGLLKLFSSYGIRATWACVGALGCANWNEYFARAPQPPHYLNSQLQVKQQYAELDPNGELHFAPALLRQIVATPGQELGTHTFSHLFAREPGVNSQDFKNDLEAVFLLWMERFGFVPKSLVFPRNQYAFLDTIEDCNIKIWRGNPSLWYYECTDSRTNRLFPRSLRFKDSVNPYLKLSCPTEQRMTRATLFLRTDLPEAIWRLHKARIRREIDGVCAGEVFHLWWHPENLGCDTKLRLARVSEILDMIAEKIKRTGLTTHSMEELRPD